MFLKVLVLCAFVGAALALHEDLKCWKCTPDYNKDCSNINDAQSEACSTTGNLSPQLANDHSCIVYSYENEGKRQTHRKCVSHLERVDMCKPESLGLGTLELKSCKQCQEDNCNGASTLSIGFFNFILVAVAAYFCKS